MPFPLAHPVAVLPLRRYCPKYLSFPALVVGSLCPDAGYFPGRLNASDFSHQFLGSFGFCLPVGVLLLLVFYFIVVPGLERLPQSCRNWVPPFEVRPLGPPLIVLFSLLVGAWSHLLLDSFTHTGGWTVEHLPILKVPLGHVAGRSVRICHLLWYGCSFGGIILLFLAYDRWLQSRCGRIASAGFKRDWASALLLAVLIVPIELIHHLIHGARGLCLVVALTFLAVMLVGLKISRRQRDLPDRTVD